MKNFTAVSVALVALTLALPAQAQDVSGRWEGELPFSGVIELQPFALELTVTGEEVRGSFFFVGQELPVAGGCDAATGELDLTLDDYEDSGEFDLVLRDGEITGTFTHTRIGSARFRAARPDDEPEPERLVVDFSKERPENLTLASFPEGVGGDIRDSIVSEMDRSRVVGLSVAVVFEGELSELGGLGWENHHADTPATNATRYRWASISKPVTAMAVLQLFEAGRLELDADVREYVPEFPDLGAVVTPRHLLCHQAGIVHYRHMRMRTLRDYDHPHPWTDAIIALDMFKESPLLFEPGSRYSYTTPGYVLLGAVIEKAGHGTYVEQVQGRICKPLGMTTMEPDRQWGEPIPHRARGYHQEGDEWIDSGDNNISWKLAAGGWISTVGDLARFGQGLMGPDMLSVETQLAMWEPQVTSSGEKTTYGLGVGVGHLDEALTVSHSGGQRKTSTYLLCAPEYGTAVALMCNTSGTPLGGLAEEIMTLLLAHQEG